MVLFHPLIHLWTDFIMSLQGPNLWNDSEYRPPTGEIPHQFLAFARQPGRFLPDNQFGYRVTDANWILPFPSFLAQETDTPLPVFHQENSDLLHFLTPQPVAYGMTMDVDLADQRVIPVSETGVPLNGGPAIDPATWNFDGFNNPLIGVPPGFQVPDMGGNAYLYAKRLNQDLRQNVSQVASALSNNGAPPVSMPPPNNPYASGAPPVPSPLFPGNQRPAGALNQLASSLGGVISQSGISAKSQFKSPSQPVTMTQGASHTVNTVNSAIGAATTAVASGLGIGGAITAAAANVVSSVVQGNISAAIAQQQLIADTQSENSYQAASEFLNNFVQRLRDDLPVTTTDVNDLYNALNEGMKGYGGDLKDGRIGAYSKSDLYVNYYSLASMELAPALEAIYYSKGLFSKDQRVAIRNGLINRIEELDDYLTFTTPHPMTPEEVASTKARLELLSDSLLAAEHGSERQREIQSEMANEMTTLFPETEHFLSFMKTNYESVLDLLDQYESVRKVQEDLKEEKDSKSDDGDSMTIASSTRKSFANTSDELVVGSDTPERVEHFQLETSDFKYQFAYADVLGDKVKQDVQRSHTDFFTLLREFKEEFGEQNGLFQYAYQKHSGTDHRAGNTIDFPLLAVSESLKIYGTGLADFNAAKMIINICNLRLLGPMSLIDPVDWDLPSDKKVVNIISSLMNIGRVMKQGWDDEIIFPNARSVVEIFNQPGTVDALIDFFNSSNRMFTSNNTFKSHYDSALKTQIGKATYDLAMVALGKVEHRNPALAFRLRQAFENRVGSLPLAPTQASF